MSELNFPDFNSLFPCFSIPFICDRRDCYYYEETTEEFGNCTLRVANQGAHKLERLSEILGITRERVRQIEASALRHLAWTATVRGLSDKVRNVISETFGEVYYWPLQPFDIQKYRLREKPSELELLDKAFYLGILNEFVKKEAEFPMVECLQLEKIVSGLICLLCHRRQFCETSSFVTGKPEDYLTVSSFSEILTIIKVRLGLISSRDLPESIPL